MNKTLAFCLSVFLITGIAILCLGIYLIDRNGSFGEKWIKTDSEITSIEEAIDYAGDKYRKILIKYEFDGEEYEDINVYNYNKEAHIGKIIKVYVSSENPYRITLNASENVLILISMGALMTIIFSSPYIYAIVKYVKRKNLYERGRATKVYDFEVAYNTALRVNGHSPFVIICRVKDKNKVYEYKSQNIWEDPQYYVDSKEYLEVYIDPNNPKNYVVDVRELKNKKTK